MLHINQFLDRLRAADARQQRNFTMTMHEARNLHADITKLLLAVQSQHTTDHNNSAPTEVEISGGGF